MLNYKQKEEAWKSEKRFPVEWVKYGVMYALDEHPIFTFLPARLKIGYAEATLQGIRNSQRYKFGEAKDFNVQGIQFAALIGLQTTPLFNVMDYEKVSSLSTTVAEYVASGEIERTIELAKSRSNVFFNATDIDVSIIDEVRGDKG